MIGNDSITSWTVLKSWRRNHSIWNCQKKKKKICLQNLSNISFFGILPTNFCATIADSKPNGDMSFIVCFNSSVSSLFSLILTFEKSSGTFNRAHNAKKGNELLINANPPKLWTENFSDTEIWSYKRMNRLNNHDIQELLRSFIVL